MVSNAKVYLPHVPDGLVRERQGSGDQGGGNNSSLLTSDWLCEGRAREPLPG